ncbi:hypothetical protein HYW11_03500 [Candidatus Peregrinibacteria bacterium]|nr:hypothetical protein [Candidatus Peregrinibacteria bacterium]
MVKHATEMGPDRSEQEHTAVSFKLGMSPDVFRSLQDDFVRDLAEVLGCDPQEIKIIDVRPASPEECERDTHPEESDEHPMLRWKDLPPDHPIRKSRDEQYRKIRALKESWRGWEKPPRVSEETLAQAVVGYAAYIDQCLLGCKDYPTCKIIVDMSQQPPVLRLPDGTSITMSALAAAVEFCTGMPKGTRSSKLVEAITASLVLAVNREVLPKVVVENEGTNIVFRPCRDDFLERLKKRNL